MTTIKTVEVDRIKRKTFSGWKGGGEVGKIMPDSSYLFSGLEFS